jgi:hypothetical protein
MFRPIKIIRRSPCVSARTSSLIHRVCVGTKKVAMNGRRETLNTRFVRPLHVTVSSPVCAVVTHLYPSDAYMPLHFTHTCCLFHIVLKVNSDCFPV